ncbi:MAG TPA: ATP-binding cassette domain-containing protein [Desulfobulbus sp.]|nr:ATP-binding cassette domain-containing protein [Desulfobulbus sp.]
MIELADIHKRFGRVEALAGVSMRIRAGSVHGIVGENGAGKSTLMKILTGFISRSSGTIRYNGRPVQLRTPRDAARLGIGMLYQEPLDFPHLTVLDNFMIAAPEHDPGRLRQQLVRLADRFGFDLAPDSAVERLTVGERQQLELLRLIHRRCKVLILDEPTTGISQRQQEILFAALRALRDEGRAILLVSHKLAEVRSLCDRVTVLRGGRAVADQERPLDENLLLRAMFGSLPRRQRTVRARDRGRPILAMDHVVSAEGRSGLHDVTLSIAEKEVVGLAGLDGSGQAVFLRIAGGLLRPDSGSVRFPGCETTAGAGGGDRQTVFLPADRLREGLIAGLSIREHLLLAGDAPFFLAPSTGRARAEKTIADYNIIGRPSTPADGLSGGNQQRLLLSLVPEPARLILLENPTRGLDVRSGAWMWRFLHQRMRDDGAIVFASPDLEEIMTQATRIMVFFNGRIILDAPTDQTEIRTVSRAITGRVPEDAGLRAA